jgi:hypothetical protein
VEPWTQRIILRWVTELRFYERRIEVLRAVKDEGLLHAFAVTEGDVRGRLAGDDCEMILAPSLLDITLHTPGVDLARIWRAVEIVMAAVKPERPVGFQAFFQYLAPLDLDFDSAIARGRQRLFRLPLPTGDVDFTDWAITADLSVAGTPDVTAQTEFGIVRREEIPGRLQRLVGRMSRIAGAARPGANLDMSAFADVSLFADSMWNTSYKGEESFCDAALQFLKASRTRADGVVEGLYVALTNGEEKTMRKVLPQ